MKSQPAPRDVFPLRFKKARNREALRRLAELTGQSMPDVAERAVEHEIVLLSADLEERLAEALEVVRAYSPATDLEAYIDAAADDGGDDLGPGLRVLATHATPEEAQRRPPAGAPALGVLAAFARS